MSVELAIAAAIEQMEHKYGIRVLYAAESGSRAWGFASPDSDYDVRFIYLKPLRWYLSIGDPSDTHEAMLPGDLDLSGWELRKALRLYAKGNMALNEWLGSPQIYRELGATAQQLRQLLPQWFQPMQAAHHYLSMGRGTYQDYLQTDAVAIKKLFYALRPLLACRWVRLHGTQPPTDFAELLEGVELTSRERTEVDRALLDKAAAVEQQAWPLSRWWRHWLETELSLAEAAMEGLPTRKRPPLQTLDHYLQQALMEVPDDPWRQIAVSPNTTSARDD